MGELHKYRAKVNGHDTVLKLSDDDAAKFYPDAERIDGAATADASADATTARPARKTRAAANKARTAAPGTAQAAPDAPADK